MKEIINCENPTIRDINWSAKRIVYRTGNKKLITDGDLMDILIEAKAILECLEKLDKGE